MNCCSSPRLCTLEEFLFGPNPANLQVNRYTGFADKELPNPVKPHESNPKSDSFFNQKWQVVDSNRSMQNGSFIIVAND